MPDSWDSIAHDGGTEASRHYVKFYPVDLMLHMIWLLDWVNQHLKGVLECKEGKRKSAWMQLYNHFSTTNLVYWSDFYLFLKSIY